MDWFSSVKSPKLKSSKKAQSGGPSGLWTKCTSCSEILQVSKLEENGHICPHCDHHFRMPAYARLRSLFDEGEFLGLGEELYATNPLKFVDKKDYEDRLKSSYEKTGLNDSAVAGVGKLEGNEVAIAAMDFSFMGASMGVVTGEKIARVFDQAYARKIPAIVISCSGGARMQEGILSLMQMAKVSAARKKLQQAGLPYISVLTDPTTGGCAASFAMQGDINIAEPKALIGFAGPRVIEQTIREKLPDGFQRSEFLLEHGFIDRIVHRRDLKGELSFFIKAFMNHAS